MPWGVPTGRLNGMLDDPMQPQMPPPTLPIMGAEAPVAPITANGAIQHALKPGFFQQGGTGMRIAGILGDALAAAGGGQQVYAQSLLRKQQQGLEEAQYANHLRLQQEYEAKKPHFATDNEGNIISINPADGASRVVYHGTPKKDDHQQTYEWLQRTRGQAVADQYADSIGHPDPDVTITLPGNRLYSGPRSGVGAALTGQAPPKPVGKLTPIDGGPAPQGPGTFPRPGLTIEQSNNPGALRVPGSQTFQRFGTPQQGVQAQEALLQRRYLGKGLNTVSSIVETYAPRQSRGGDNTDAQVNNYIGYVSRRLGIHPGEPIPPNAVPQLAAAMREFETGRRGS